jgi:predicted GIY-YIG superfamily endonuclease
MAINGGLAVPPELAVNVERYAVYRCYADDGQLLYVGETGDLGTRLASHAQKLWFTQVRGITLEWYADELDALNAERRAIHVEHPKYNVVHRNTVTIRRPGPRKEAKPRQPTARQAPMTWAQTRVRVRELQAERPGISASEIGRRLGVSDARGRQIVRRLDTEAAA